LESYALQDSVRPFEVGRRAHARLPLILIGIVGAGALLRFWALGYGIPFTIGVDEPEVVVRALRMIKTGDFNPHFFDYPTLYIYLQALVAIPRFLWGALQGDWAKLADAPSMGFYEWARALTAALGTATVYLVYRCAQRWGRGAALVAAALMAVMPLHVRESHFALTDVPATFFVALTWLLAIDCERRPDARHFALAGAAAGLAAATKYNAAFALIMPLLACAAVRPIRGSRLRSALVVLSSAAVAFVIAMPYAVLDLPAFLDGFAGLVAAVHRATPVEAPALTYLKHLRNALGWPAALLALSGLLVGIGRIAKGPDRLRWALAIVPPVVYYAFISRQHLVFARYLLPAVPFVVVLAAAAIVELWRGAERFGVSTRGAAAAAAVLAFAAIAPGAITSTQFVGEISRTWTGELAYRWMLEHVPRGSRVVIESRNLLLPAGYDSTNVPQLRQKTLEDYRSAGVAYLVASSQCYGAYFAAPAAVPGAYADYQRLFHGTEEVARFIPSKDHPGSELRILRVPQ
jgi:4-amino-4-deoxy-L-arabinose transferase-like glycosyltransferase